MKICLYCQSEYSASAIDCMHCSTTTPVINGFAAYAPEMAHNGGGFKADFFASLAALEAKNFWFRSRNKVISWVLNRYKPNFKSMLEIGCGTGFVISHLVKQFPDVKFSGSEIFTAGLSHAAKRVQSANLMQMDARKIPFINEFDIIGAFDVLEHIKEDEVVLKEIYKALNTNGMLVLTVPQHQWLWSQADQHACHERRYSASELKEKLHRAGFEIVRSTSFITFLLPLMVVSRMNSHGGDDDYDSTAELKLNPILNAILEKILTVELFFIKLGVHLPIGGSRLVVARKK